MNMESTVAGAESTEREDFTKVDTRLDEIKSMNMGDMSDDDLENVMAERKALRSQQAEMMGVAQVEATAENQERSDAEKVAEVAKAEAEAAAQVEKAKQVEERKQAEAVQIEALTAEIKGASAEKKEGEIMDEASATNAMVEAARAYRDGGSVDRTQYDATWKNIPDAIRKAPGFSDKVSSAMNIDKAEDVVEQAAPATQEQQAEVSAEKLSDVNFALMSLYESAGYSSFGDKINGVQKSIYELPEEEQSKMAEKFFEQTIDRNVANNKGAYKVYMQIGGAFHKKFRELEDARLKSAGYSSGFTM